MRIRLLLFGTVLGLSSCSEPDRPPSPQPITVFAAASLIDAMEALADSFETAYPSYKIVVNAAATSMLARQIEQGAPADVFFSANTEWMAYLDERGRLAGAAAEPLGNRLVVVAPAGSTPWERPEALLALPRLALADPEHVPAGLYARQALECMELWTPMAPRVVPMLNVRAALLAVRNGAAQAAMVYASDVQAAATVRVVLSWPEPCQPDIRYAVAQLRQAPNPAGARRFMAFATAPARAPLWERYGFRTR